jgi:hypothetical protein
MPYAVSSGGMHVGGEHIIVNIRTYPFLWTPSRGILDFHRYLSTLGINLNFQPLIAIRGISGDGSAMVGHGYGPEYPDCPDGKDCAQAWIVRLGSPCPGDLDADNSVDIPDLTILLAHIRHANRRDLRRRRPQRRWRRGPARPDDPAGPIRHSMSLVSIALATQPMQNTTMGHAAAKYNPLNCVREVCSHATRAQ